MGSSGYGFHFATTLSAMHFLVCGVTVLLTQGKKVEGEPKAKMPIQGRWEGRRCRPALLSCSLPFLGTSLLAMCLLAMKADPNRRISLAFRLPSCRHYLLHAGG
jgi:hypothetical protein